MTVRHERGITATLDSAEGPEHDSLAPTGGWPGETSSGGVVQWRDQSSSPVWCTCRSAMSPSERWLLCFSPAKNWILYVLLLLNENTNTCHNSFCYSGLMNFSEMII